MNGGRGTFDGGKVGRCDPWTVDLENAKGYRIRLRPWAQNRGTARQKYKKTKCQFRVNLTRLQNNLDRSEWLQKK